MADPAPDQSSSTVLVIPQSAPVGSLIITNPPATATSYYKIAPNNLVTFQWSYTYLQATPTSLTVSAICGLNGNTYPVGPNNGVIPGTATEVVWDVNSYQQANPGKPLAQATYTLEIYDDRGRDARPQPGYLTMNSGLQFALYTPQAYTAISDGWSCTTCTGGAVAFATHPAAISIIVTMFIMLFSGFHLIRNWSPAKIKAD